MTLIRIKTTINASIDICFDLSRSIELHQDSTKGTNERAVAGRMSGLIEMDECVTWQATHFNIRQKLTAKVTAFERPFYFEDRMIQGAFKSFVHKHIFERIDGITVMTDEFEYEVPFGLLGKWIDSLMLEKHMKKFLLQRNLSIKEAAESEAKNQYFNY